MTRNTAAATSTPGRRFFRRDAATLARALLGQRIESTVGGIATAGVIAETEAYLGVSDKAAHTYGGRCTERNQAMWGDAGHAYVYFVYGMHHCMNVVAGAVDEPVAVLIRALIPTDGVDTMYARRAAARRDRDLCSGPARLCQALGITRALDGTDLCGDGDLRIVKLRQRALPARSIETGPRIGIDYAEEWRDRPLRFWMRDCEHVSRG